MYNSICQADNNGRMLLTDSFDRMELIDSEFNLMDFTGQLLDESRFTFPEEYHYNSDRNEIIAFPGVQNMQNRVLIIFHLTEI